MSIVLARVDDRMIHGQVVLGWAHPLSASLIVLVDDGIAATEWEQEIYRSAVPGSIDVIFASVEDACRLLPDWSADRRRAILIAADLASMNELRKARPEIITRVNLGGIHHRPGRVERLRYIYLDDSDAAGISEMVAAGVQVSARDLPTSVEVPAEALLR